MISVFTGAIAVGLLGLTSLLYTRWMATQQRGALEEVSDKFNELDEFKPDEGVAEWGHCEGDHQHCHNEGMAASDTFSVDPSTLSRPDFWRVLSTHFDLAADFDKKVLKGYVDLVIEKQASEENTLVLDTRDLTIESAAVLDGKRETAVPFVVGKGGDFRGAKLKINLPPSSSSRLAIRIQYATSPGSSGLVWLRPEQTSTKTHPYLYSHSEAIHGRSIFPCQDTPSVKSTYTAKITVDKGLTVLMSAVGKGAASPALNGQVSFEFEQKVPIPSYLVAIAIGNVESRKIGPRSRVWAEGNVVDRAAYEFAETEEMLQAAEALVGPYVWGVYDLLVLPPSFPFGGMENPCLTFLTPTLLAGDRSLANVVAHEIAHSWTGNLVTNLNWEHFWLNEGFTVFLERKIKGSMMGEPYRQFSAIEGWKSLIEEVKTRGADHPFTKLIPDLKDCDPDDAFGSVPYEKGHSFLYYLEQLVGGAEIFNPCFRAWIEKYKYSAASSFDFQKHFEEYFRQSVKPEVLSSVDWKTWLHGTGMPPVELKFDNSLAQASDALCGRWLDAKDCSCFSPEDIASFTAAQMIEFLAQLLLQPPLPVEKLQALDKCYNLTASQNAEIKFRWLRLCLRGKWEDMIEPSLAFAAEYQRMKFCRPIFRECYAWDKSKDLAVETYKKYRDTMSYVTATMLAKDLQLSYP